MKALQYLRGAWRRQRRVFVRPEFGGVGLDLGLGQTEDSSLLGMGEELERFC